MNKLIITIALVTTGLVVGVVIGRLKKQQDNSKISSLYIGDIRDYEGYL